ncbi:IclR family transcriptional regulator [Acrocarpospora catenulata]|uniref:IclR family transcriptional regulator n=1 Tax=Acrocarpospora catenulata TaxID=2836182 RepID=UPI001BDAF1AB|nr:IclR family transcriptional regulator [Acrocarpospora catenulata]
MPGADEQAGRSAGSRIAVIEKAVKTLDALLPVTDGLTPTQVAEVIGTNRSTAFRLLASLEHGGLLDRDPSTGRYHLSMKLLQYGSAVRSRMPIIRVAESTLANLRDETRQSVLLAVREGWGARCLSRLPGLEVDVVSWTTGEWLPMHLGAAPQALMSAMSDAEIDHYLAENTDWHTLQGDRTADDIRKGIALIRQRGWALNQEGIAQGVASLGAVVYNRSGVPVCAISVAGLEHHYTEPRLERTAAAVLAAAKEIREKLD